MKCKLSPLLAVLLLASVSCFAQTEATSTPSVLVLHNSDVLRMFTDGVKPGEIIARIVTSSCAFDTFPPVIKDLQMRGIPDTVLMAMKMVPYGPPAMAVAAPPKTMVAPPRVQVRIPAGTMIDIEAAKAVSSADVDKGNVITFLVSRRVFVNGVLVIDRGAVATALAIKSKRAGSWGRGGTLEFALENVVAVDGTQVPIRLSNEVKGNDHSTAVAAAAIVTGAVAFPYGSPAALFWALKKGDDAILNQGTNLTAVVRNTQEIAGLLPEKKEPVFHSVESINLQNSSQGKGLPPFNNSFRPTPFR
jgi:hypothetical protein